MATETMHEAESTLQHTDKMVHMKIIIVLEYIGYLAACKNWSIR